MNYIILLVLVVVTFINIGSTFDFNGKCELIDPLGPCNTTVPNNTMIYLNSTQTQQDLNKDAKYYLNIIGLLSSESDKKCVESAVTFICSLYYKPCITYNVSITNITYPSLPCRSICDEAAAECAAYASLFPTTCDSTTDGYPNFPNIETNFPVSPNSSNTINVQCNNNYISGNISNCFDPLIFVDDEMIKHPAYFYIKGRCAISCPFQIFSKSAEDSIYYLQVTLNSLSFVGSVILVLFYGILPNKIDTKMETILSFAISTIIFEISYFMADKDKKSFCGDNDRYMTSKDAKCAFNGILFQFGALTTIFWWTAICNDFYFSIRMQKFRYFKYLRVAIWSVATILTIIPMIGMQYQATPVTSGCWINGEYSDAYQYACFYVISWICLGLILFFTVFSITKIYSIYKILHDKKVILYTIKQIFLMIWILFNFVFINAFKFYMNAKKDKYYKAVEDWVDCSAKNGKDNCTLNIDDYQFRLLQIITTCDVGLIGMLAFMEPNNIKTFKESRIVKKVFGYMSISFSSTEESISDPSQTNRKSTNMRRMTSKSITTASIETANNSTDTPSEISTLPPVTESTSDN